MAHSSRTWTGARTPQALKRVRQSARRRAILQPRRSEAKTLVSKAIVAATSGEAETSQAALIAAISALDKAAKTGAIHANAANRRKSRLMLKVNAALGGESLVTSAKVARQTGRAAQAKATKARIAAGKAAKAKGEQTAAGKARAAVSRSTREAKTTTNGQAETAATEATPAKTTTRRTTKSATATKSAAKAAAPKATTRRTTKSAASATPTEEKND